MARRRPRPKMTLNIGQVNSDAESSELEQSFMVSSDAFTAAGMKVHGNGLEVIDGSQDGAPVARRAGRLRRGLGPGVRAGHEQGLFLVQEGRVALQEQLLDAVEHVEAAGRRGHEQD